MTDLDTRTLAALMATTGDVAALAALERDEPGHSASLCHRSVGSDGPQRLLDAYPAG